jgi:hypothetical protein
MAVMPGKIFINYRRGDESGKTGRLFDRLQDIFPPEQLFLDVDNIAPGLDFVGVLNERVAECDIVLAVIGKGWIDARDATGKRRLDDPDDFVRIEIESALSQGKRVIPVLVGEAQMPRPQELPESLQPLARRNAVRLTHERFRADTQGLVKALQQSLEEIEVIHQREAEAARNARAEEERRLREADTARDEEARRRHEAEAARHAEAERRRQQADAARHAEEERRRQETEATRRAQEEEQRKQAEREAREHAAAERRRQEIAAKQRTEEERAFAVAKRAGTILALDAFLGVHPTSPFADEARKLNALLQAREESYHRALASDDPGVLKSFLATYGKGADADRVRLRLRRLEPRHSPQPAIVILGAVLAVLCAGAAVFWMAHTSPPSPAVTAASPPAQSANSALPETKTKAADVAPVPSPDTVAWLLLKDTTDGAALKRFIGQFPDSPLRKDAETRIAALASAQPARQAALAPDQIAWDLVKDSKDPDELRRFVGQFPNGAHRADAEQRIASLAAAALQTAPANMPDPHELARSLQFELKRVGCFDGIVNGEFDDATKAGWQNFIKLTSISPPDEVSPDAINAVRGVNTRVCPLACPAGQHIESGLCVGNAPPGKRATPGSGPSQPSAQAPQGTTVVNNIGVGPGKITQGGVTTCGRNGCQYVPKNCHAVTGSPGAPGFQGLGGKIICP